MMLQLHQHGVCESTQLVGSYDSEIAVEVLRAHSDLYVSLCCINFAGSDLHIIMCSAMCVHYCVP